MSFPATTTPPPAPPVRIDAGEGERTIGLLFGPADVFEVRVLKAHQGGGGWTFNGRGYFRGSEARKVVQALERLDGWSGIYVTLNEIERALHARCGGRIERADRDASTVSDSDVTRRRRLLLDFDPGRPSGISSTNDEHAAALELLGRAGGDGAYELVAAYAAQAPSGSIDAPTYRARLAVPLALGWLARSDDRALSILIAATKGAADATWSYRHMDASRVADLLRRHAGSGLALSRRPEAVARLREMAAEPAAGLGAHAAALLADEHVMGREER